MTTPQSQPSLTPLRRLEDWPQTGDCAYDAEGVRDAFVSFRHHELQAQLRVLQEPPAGPEPTSPEQGEDAS